MAPFISVQSLSLSYQKRNAFKDISVTLKKDQITTLIGPSGCGKTSFISCFNRLTDLVPFCQVSGQIQIEEKSILDKNIDVIALRKRVGMIFQKPNPFPISIRNNIVFPLKEHGTRNRAKQEEIVTSVLQDVGLFEEVKDKLNSSATLLSGGQQQRLCIARALALKPEIILLDEPCSALDPISSGVVEDLMLSLAKRYTLLVVTHNLAQAKRIADEVLFFWMKENSGCLIESGPAKQIFENPQSPLTEAYIHGAKG